MQFVSAEFLSYLEAFLFLKDISIKYFESFSSVKLQKILVRQVRLLTAPANSSLGS